MSASSECLKSEFSEFLRRFPHEIWLTVTFEKELTASTAKKKFKYFLKYLNNPDEIFYHKSIYLWVFFEKNTYRKGVHIHALIHGIDVSKSALLETKLSLCFGESKAIAVHENVIPYIAKKYISPALEDFDYWKINSRLRKFN